MQTETMTQTHHRMIASDRVEGTPVRRPTGQRIGTIQRLMIDKLSGQVCYAVLRFGGFLGMGDRHLPVAWERLRYDPALGGYALDITAEELQRAETLQADPEFDWGNRRYDTDVNDQRTTPALLGCVRPDVLRTDKGKGAICAPRYSLSAA